jgi:hypothetical protein
MTKWGCGGRSITHPHFVFSQIAEIPPVFWKAKLAYVAFFSREPIYFPSPAMAFMLG